MEGRVGTSFTMERFYVGDSILVTRPILRQSSSTTRKELCRVFFILKVRRTRTTWYRWTDPTVCETSLSDLTVQPAGRRTSVPLLLPMSLLLVDIPEGLPHRRNPDVS